jgi:hypothetical protein
MKTKLTKQTKPDARLQSRPEQVGTQTNQSPVSSLQSPVSPHPWTGVFFDGPEAEQNREGEEILVWHVYVGTEDAEPVRPSTSRVPMPGGPLAPALTQRPLPFPPQPALYPP